MSLLKYRDQSSSHRGPIHWQRADIDGAPYRGPEIPLLREEEFEAYAERERDIHVAVFELWNPDHLAKYQEILDKVGNEWYTLLKDQTMPVPEKHSFVVLCAWSENTVTVPQSRVDAILGMRG